MGFSRLKKIFLYTKNQLSSSKIDNFRAKKLYWQNADFRNPLPATLHCAIKMPLQGTNEAEFFHSNFKLYVDSWSNEVLNFMLLFDQKFNLFCISLWSASVKQLIYWQMTVCDMQTPLCCGEGEKLYEIIITPIMERWLWISLLSRCWTWRYNQVIAG